MNKRSGWNGNEASREERQAPIEEGLSCDPYGDGPQCPNFPRCPCGPQLVPPVPTSEKQP